MLYKIYLYRTTHHETEVFIKVDGELTQSQIAIAADKMGNLEDLAERHSEHEEERTTNWQWSGKIHDAEEGEKPLCPFVLSADEE